ncbi:MAG: ABC transporter substrate-binding protein [Gammaproteobacteria bacterium]
MFRVATIALVLWAGLLFVSTGKAQEQAGPQQLVQQTTDQVLDILSKRRKELEKDHKLIYELTNEIVVPHFDFVSISKFVLARYWRKASKEQKLRFIRAFRELMVKTYAIAILEYNDNKIEYLPLRDDVTNGDVTVRTEFHQPGKPPVAINYSLHQRKTGWKVYDISVDGVSIVTTFRTSFGTEIKQSSLDAVIERIEKKNNEKNINKKATS